MPKFSWFPVERHILVKGKSSPDDLDLQEYWRKRNMAKAKDLTYSKGKIARKQAGRCPVCGESLFNDEALVIHHKNPIKEGGTNSYSNLQLLHLYCHQQVHTMGKKKTA